MRAEIPCKGMITILTKHMKAQKYIEKINILKHKSYKGKIQRYTRPLKNSLEPEHSSTLPDSQLELIYYIGEFSPNPPCVVP
jgi:hypothetical protein